MLKKRGDRVSTSFFSLVLPSKKGQLTVFIIIGILLILSVVLIFTLRSELTTFKPDSVAPTQKGAVSSFITSCMEQVGDDALYLVGLHGGYITVPQSIAQDGARHLALSPADVVPYWAYGETVDYPSLQRVKYEIDTYMETHLRDCVLSLSPFENTYTIVEKSPLTADTQLLDAGTFFTVNWDVEIHDAAGEVVSEFFTHTAESPVKLKTAHETAATLVAAEMTQLKLEDITQDLLALNAPEVPLTGIELSCTTKKWPVTEVKAGVQELLRVNLPQLQVLGTDVVDYPENFDYYENHYQWKLENEFVAEDIAVQFHFENNYPFSFAVTPQSGGYLRSNQLGGDNQFVPLCIQNWKFVYDLAYPVLVDVIDTSTGYRFKIALTVHLNNNIPDRSAAITPTQAPLVATSNDEAFCAESSIPMLVTTSSVVENPATGVYEKKDLGDVDLIFSCLQFSCPIPSSEYDFAGSGLAGVRTNFPYCAGAIIRGSKDGYKDGWTRVVSSPGKEVSVELTPLFSIPLNKITLVAHDLDDPTVTSALRNDETVLITVSYTKPGETEPFHESSVTLAPSIAESFIAEQELTLLAGADFTYDVTITLLESNQILGGYRGTWDASWAEATVAEGLTVHLLRGNPRSQTEEVAIALALETRSQEVAGPTWE